MSNRRSFLLGFGAILAAPAVVRAESLMRVAALRSSVLPPPPLVRGGCIQLNEVVHLLMPGLQNLFEKQGWGLDYSMFEQ